MEILILSWIGAVISIVMLTALMVYPLYGDRWFFVLVICTYILLGILSYNNIMY